MAKLQKLNQRLNALEAITPAEPLQIQIVWQHKAIDGTYNIVLNVPEYCLPQVQTMMGWLKDLVRVVMAKEQQSE